MADWEVIRAEYIAGDVSYRRLAEKHGVSFSTLRQIGAREKWTDLRNKARTKREQKSAEKIGRRQAREDANTVILLDSAVQSLLDCVTQFLAERQRGEKEFTAQEMRAISATLRDIREQKSIKSERDIREQEARIAKLEKEVSEDAAAPVITVQLSDGLREWSE